MFGYWHLHGAMADDGGRGGWHHVCEERERSRRQQHHVRIVLRLQQVHLHTGKQKAATSHMTLPRMLRPHGNAARGKHVCMYDMCLDPLHQIIYSARHVIPR